MTAAWAKLWLFFFLLNEDYERYCLAIRKKDSKTAISLEKQFPKIAELYEDWGDIHQMLLRDWWPTHEHLFITNAREVKEVPSKHNGSTTSMYLEIPLDMPVSKVTQQAAALIRKRYRESQIQRPSAKYTLALKQTSFNSWVGYMKILDVWKRVLTGQHTNISLAMELAEDKGWDWDPTDDSFLVNIDDRAGQVKRYKREAKSIIANTINGKFPVKK